MTFLFFKSWSDIIILMLICQLPIDPQSNDAGLSADWNFGAEARPVVVRYSTAQPRTVSQNFQYVPSPVLF
jgi:hypothetical protein